MKRVMYFASAAVLLVAPAVYSQRRRLARRLVSRPACSAAMPASKPTSPPPPRRCRTPTTRSRSDRCPKRGPTDSSSPTSRNRSSASARASPACPTRWQGKNLEQELKTKAELTKALADSFAICDKAFDAVTDANATEMVKAGQNEQTRAASLYGVIVHGNEIAGTAYAYLRTKGLVPPSTERAGMRGRGNN